jgi:SAM-dependent methyltransferase
MMPEIPLISLAFFALAAAFAYFFLSGFIWGAGYYPTSRKEIDGVAKLLDLDGGSVFYDLGSGFGRMIIAMAERYDVKCVGVEIDPIKYYWTKLMIMVKNLSGKVSVIHENLLDFDLRNAEKIFIFLSPETKIMPKLKEKIFTECKLGTKVVSYVHRFQDWQAEQSAGELTLYRVSKQTIRA